MQIIDDNNCVIDNNNRILETIIIATMIIIFIIGVLSFIITFALYFILEIALNESTESTKFMMFGFFLVIPWSILWMVAINYASSHFQ